MVSPPSKFYTVCTVLFYKYGGENVAVTNFMPCYSMFIPTKVAVKLSNRNTVHDQLISIILCRFPNCFITYTVGLVYYFPGNPSNTILSGALKFFVGFQKFASETLEHSDLLNLKVVLRYHHTRLKNIFTVLKSKFSKSTLTETGILLSQLSVHFQNKSQLIHQRFVHVSINILKQISRKGLMEGLSENLLGL